jgi:uroporphyrinogen III methyltransferase/synthase
VRDARAFGPACIAAVGPGTAAALAEHGLVADLVPPQAVAESLVAAFPGPGPGPGPGRSGGSVLIPQAAGARPVLAAGLRARGWDVEVVEAYRTEPACPSPAALAAAAGADAVAFTSSSTVTNYLAAAGADHVPPVVACIGPVTAATARDSGLHVATVAAEHTVDGLVAALVGALVGAHGAPA